MRSLRERRKADRLLIDLCIKPHESLVTSQLLPLFFLFLCSRFMIVGMFRLAHNFSSLEKMRALQRRMRFFRCSKWNTKKVFLPFLAKRPGFSGTQYFFYIYTRFLVLVVSKQMKTFLHSVDCIIFVLCAFVKLQIRAIFLNNNDFCKQKLQRKTFLLSLKIVYLKLSYLWTLSWFRLNEGRLKMKAWKRAKNALLQDSMNHSFPFQAAMIKKVVEVKIQA